MIPLETHFELKPGGAVRVGVEDAPMYKAGSGLADRVSSGGLLVINAEFSELGNSMHSLDTLQEIFNAERSGGYIES